MNYLNEELPAIAYFQSLRDKSVELTKICKINPYTGGVNLSFNNNIAKYVRFEYQGQTHQYKLTSMGGRYFIDENENTPFATVFKLDKELPEKSKIKKLKI